MEIEEKLAELNKLREEAKAGGGPKRIEAQHAKGKLTARERIALLFDPGTFQEIDPFVIHRCTDFGMAETRFLGDSVVTGYGKVNNRLTFAFSQDFTVLGGSLSEVASQKICQVMDLSAMNGAPFVGILDSGGARIQEGADSLTAYGNIFTHNTLYSGTVPQISVIVGPTAGGAVYSPAITDFVFMVKGIGQSYITGSEVVKSVTGEEVTLEELGGALVNATKSGNAHFALDSEEECFRLVRKLLGFLPQSYKETPSVINTGDDPNRISEELLHIVPLEHTKPYNMRQIITKVVDNGDFLEVHGRFARNFVVGFARLGGRSIGILANQPMHLAGVLDIDASDKAARFVRTCDCFNIPLVTFVDVPGYMPGTDQEFRGIIRHGAKLLFAYSEATVPKVSIITRKAYGGAYVAMSSKSLRGDICYAWPTAEIAVMGPEGAVNIVFRNEISKSENPAETRQRLIQGYRDKFANPYVAAARGYIDDVIDPRTTRSKVIRALEMLQGKEVKNPPKKHGNIPL
ncbi:MAG: methylmalonyl-CoA carboxyltransferase [Chloroflexi bacterium CG_4_9_14_3_um_filter_45_9]|nr:MAG: methylmalonyl-CoA carboxyltransferase [Dehalococcoidia bacterium CG2_30_46_9]PIU23350.1 MAG: methylmalonyl-CoA carboxyltransferase [Chloroflexi bacterium CG08_land_8_20_14_0_20_45_12]PIX27705.1 MAG: methylmalonyl-CoA carboxyltransferase [Chloroflexi bacterium CG_4_8_14_3_um_filter_45_15]PJB49952.1 MAG: methylmalonyl-CoA carboxyltransferase [Chloroflexi bacterium CG_4_9_14_3_um_filter_45_9]